MVSRRIVGKQYSAGHTRALRYSVGKRHQKMPIPARTQNIKRITSKWC
jgi:hypothetical protein